MGYCQALEAAGAKIIDYNYFGSYQGDLLVIAEVDGARKYYKISYGSCSGCDHFEDVEPNTPEQLKAFGEEYINGDMTYDEILNYVKRNLEWDQDAKTMVQWLEERKEL